MDPLTGSYPWYTPYQFAGNKPIAAIDLDGAEESLEFRTRRREEALLSGGISEMEYRNQTINSGAGGVVGGLIAMELFVTKGRISQAIGVQSLLNTFARHDPPKSSEDAKQRIDDAKNEVALGLLFYSGGKFLESFKPVASNLVRRTWKQSEELVEKMFPNARRQVSFKNRVETRYGAEGSARPELYDADLQLSIEVKNYTLDDLNDVKRLSKNISGQINYRLDNLPKGTHQKIFIDITGQNVDETMKSNIRGLVHRDTATENYSIEFIN